MYHFDACRGMAAGESFKELPGLLGHGDPSITVRGYAHLSEKTKYASAKRLDA
jgi:hypothetical protein